MRLQHRDGPREPPRRRPRRPPALRRRRRSLRARMNGAPAEMIDARIPLYASARRRAAARTLRAFGFSFISGNSPSLYSITRQALPSASHSRLAHPLRAMRISSPSCASAPARRPTRSPDRHGAARRRPRRHPGSALPHAPTPGVRFSLRSLRVRAGDPIPASPAHVPLLRLTSRLGTCASAIPPIHLSSFRLAHRFGLPMSAAAHRFFGE
jgi:hypothetical protein